MHLFDPALILTGRGVGPVLPISHWNSRMSSGRKTMRPPTVRLLLTFPRAVHRSPEPAERPARISERGIETTVRVLASGRVWPEETAAPGTPVKLTTAGTVPDPVRASAATIAAKPGAAVLGTCGIALTAAVTGTDARGVNLKATVSSSFSITVARERTGLSSKAFLTTPARPAPRSPFLSKRTGAATSRVSLKRMASCFVRNGFFL